MTYRFIALSLVLRKKRKKTVLALALSLADLQEGYAVTRQNTDPFFRAKHPFDRKWKLTAFFRLDSTTERWSIPFKSNLVKRTGGNNLK